jgi:hypothetical protein
MRNETNDLRPNWGKLDDRLLNDLIFLDTKSITTMRAALQGNFDPRVDFLVRWPDAEKTLMPALAAGTLR